MFSGSQSSHRNRRHLSFGKQHSHIALVRSRDYAAQLLSNIFPGVLRLGLTLEPSILAHLLEGEEKHLPAERLEMKLGFSLFRFDLEPCLLVGKDEWVLIASY